MSSISRDQVVHVARLARLQLTDAELERYAGELSGVVDWIDKISELGDLADVEPTTSVVPIENTFRPDEPTPSLPVDVALAAAPDPGDGGFRVPSPGAGSEPS